MAPVGQLSDPYQQGEQDDEAGIVLSGLPGEPDETEPPGASGGGAGPSDADTVVYDLDDWSEIERQAVAERLREAGIPHAWEGTSLQVAAADEAPVDNVLDIVEGEAGPPLDDDRDQVAYDLTDWDDDHVTTLVHELGEAGIAHAWGDDELFVHADDEAAVDALLDRVAHPHELAAEPDDGPVGAVLLGDIFVAADRLQHDGEDHEGTAAVLDLGDRLDESRPPYGLDRNEWSHVCERVSGLTTLLRADSVDREAVRDAARDLRTVLRPYV